LPCSKNVLTLLPIPRLGWAGMSFSRILDELGFYLESGGTKREALRGLLLSGKISQNTFDLIDSKLSRLTSVVANLKETLAAEESFWKTNLTERTRILESLLVELELKRILGEIGEEEWTLKSAIINSGLGSLKKNEALTSRIEQEPALPIQRTLGERVNEKVMTELKEEDELSDRKNFHLSDKTTVRHVGNENPINVRPNTYKRRRSIAKEPPSLGNSLVSRMHCMNPWKPECKSVDIGLSIYFKGQMVPICRRCWEDISKKNIEWSSL